MSHLAVAYEQAAVTEAEAAVQSLDRRGVFVSLVVDAAGHPSITAQFSLSVVSSAYAPIIQSILLLGARLEGDPRFARDLFGHLDVEGRVYAPRPARGFHIDLDEVA